MVIGDHHHVSRCIRKSIQADIAMRTAVDDPSGKVILLISLVAKDASLVFLCSRDVGIAPRSPEVIHKAESIE